MPRREQTYLCSVSCSPRPTKCASGAHRPGIRPMPPPRKYHQAQGPGSVSLLLALCHPRPLQPLRRGLDGRAARECALGRAPAGGNLREAGHHAAPTHHSRGPRCAHAQHTRRAALLDLGITASHSRPRVSRQSVLRSAVPDREVPAGVSGTVRRARNARGVSRDLAWYRRSQRPELSDARRRHYGRAATVLAARHRTRLAAYAAHPERFVQGPPRPETMPTAVWINRPPTLTSQVAPATTTVTPVDPQPGSMRPDRMQSPGQRHQRGVK